MTDLEREVKAWFKWRQKRDCCYPVDPMVSFWGSLNDLFLDLHGWLKKLEERKSETKAMRKEIRREIANRKAAMSDVVGGCHCKCGGRK